MAINVINAKPELNVANIFATYRYPFSALFLMQKRYFPQQTNDITLTSNPSTPTVALCRNFTINSGVTYTQSYICVTATNSITINGIIDVSCSSYVTRSFFLNKDLPLYINTSAYNDIPSGGGCGYFDTFGFGGGNGGNIPNSDYVNPPFNYRVLYNNFYQETNLFKQTAQSVQKAGGYVSGRQSKMVVNAGGIVVLCAPTIVVNGNIFAYGRNDSQTSTGASGSGGGVIYLVGGTITIGNVSINAKGGNATTTGNNHACGGGGGFVVIAGTKSITNNATINVSGGTASGGSQNYNGQNGSLIVTTFSFDFDYTGNF